MQEKKKQQKENPLAGPGFGSFGFDDGASDMHSVNVGSGGYNETLPVAGKTVGEIRKRFKTRMEIDDASTPVINGKDAKEDTVVLMGQKLQFIKKAGEKGTKLDLTPEEITVIAFSLGTAIGTLCRQGDWDGAKLTTSKPATEFMDKCNSIMAKINKATGQS